MVGHKVKIQSQQTSFLSGDSSWGYDVLWFGNKLGSAGVGIKLSEKGSVKQTIAHHVNTFY